MQIVAFNVVGLKFFKKFQRKIMFFFSFLIILDDVFFTSYCILFATIHFKIKLTVQEISHMLTIPSLVGICKSTVISSHFLIAICVSSLLFMAIKIVLIAVLTKMPSLEMIVVFFLNI